MIRIKKPAKAPNILLKQGKAKRRAMSAAYTRASADYDGGAKTFEIDAKIYAHKTVKALLIQAQNDKCFLCESKVTHIGYGDVEHFRPKAGCRQSVKDKLQKPGYYWLAYEWSNLFFSCQLCNQRFKANLFPLVDDNKRARCHRDDMAQEEPLFINPAEESPENFISFNAEIPFAIGDNVRGKVTIELLGLARPKLNERRLTLYRRLKRLYDIASLVPPIPESAEALALLNAELQDASQDSAEYTAMVRAAVAAKFVIV